MGWWTELQGWGTHLYKNPTVSAYTKKLGGFTFKVVLKLFEQLSVIPKVVFSAITHKKTQRVAGHVVEITKDLLPYLLVTYTSEMLQRHGRDYLNKDANPALLSINTVLQTGLTLIQLATWVYSVREQTKMTLRSVVLTLEATNAFNEAHANPMTLCSEQKCTQQRFLKGTLRDFTAFWATEAAISLIGYVPIAGHWTAALLSVHHRGRYVMTMVLPDLCNRHQMEYLKEYPELSLSLGISQVIMGTMATRGLEYAALKAATSLQRFIPIQAAILPMNSYLQLTIRQVTLLATMNIAAHLRLPKAIAQSSRNYPDPLALYQSLVGFSFDVVAMGLKVKIPLLLKEPKSDIPWDKIISFAQKIYDHSYTQSLKFFVLPPMLHSTSEFIKDPIIAPNWEAVRQNLMQAIVSFEDIQKQLIIKMAKFTPKITSESLWLIFGIPKSLSKLLLKLMKDDYFMAEISRFRRQLEAMNPKEMPKPMINPLALELRKEIKIAPAAEKEVEKNAKTPPLINVRALIKSREINSSEMPHGIIKKTPSPIKSTAILLIKSRSAMAKSQEAYQTMGKTNDSITKKTEQKSVDLFSL